LVLGSLLLDVLNELGNAHAHLLGISGKAFLNLLDLLGCGALSIGKSDLRHSRNTGLAAWGSLLLLAGCWRLLATWRRLRWWCRHICVPKYVGDGEMEFNRTSRANASPARLLW
jgi:hypothetical protein